MRKTAAENTNFRLKTVLDVLAEGVLSGDPQNAGTVLAEAGSGLLLRAAVQPVVAAVS